MEVSARLATDLAADRANCSQRLAPEPHRRHDANAEAASFWPGVVERVAAGPIERELLGPPQAAYAKTVLRFSTT